MLFTKFLLRLLSVWCLWRSVMDPKKRAYRWTLPTFSPVSRSFFSSSLLNGAYFTTHSTFYTPKQWFNWWPLASCVTHLRWRILSGFNYSFLMVGLPWPIPVRLHCVCGLHERHVAQDMRVNWHGRWFFDTKFLRRQTKCDYSFTQHELFPW